MTASGTYTDTLQSVDGCDSTITLNLVVNPIHRDTIREAICKGGSYIFEGEVLTTAGVYTKVYQGVNGCDSVVVLDLKVNNTSEEVLVETICEGTSYTFGTQELTTSGTYTETFLNAEGCDSTVVLELVVSPTVYDTVVETIEEGNTYMFGDQELDKAGAYIDTLQTVNGCDSIVALVLKVTTKDTTNDNGVPQVRMHPNPTTDVVYLTIDNVPNATITVINMQGKVLKQYKVVTNENEVIIDVRDLESGTYTMIISNSDIRMTKKLIKKR